MGNLTNPKPVHLGKMLVLLGLIEVSHQKGFILIFKTELPLHKEVPVEVLLEEEEEEMMTQMIPTIMGEVMEVTEVTMDLQEIQIEGIHQMTHIMIHQILQMILQMILEMMVMITNLEEEGGETDLLILS